MDKRKLHDTITDNFMTLLKVGTFGMSENDVLTKMSPFKWRKLVDAAEQLYMLPYISRGAEIMKGNANISPDLNVYLESKSSETEAQRNIQYDYTKAKLFNILSSHKREGVINEETSKENVAEDTLVLLDIIIANMNDMITKDITLLGIITLGNFIRKNKNKIDYDKLTQWLIRIGLVQVASLEGSMLISCFDFTEEELPFVAKQNKKAKKLLLNPVIKVFGNHSFSNATRMDVAMLETMSNVFMKSLINIEE